MSLYRDQILPRALNVIMNRGDIPETRARVCTGLHGTVVEIGFGSGLNVPHYPAEMTEVRAVEPSLLAWRLATDRVASSPVRIERSGLDGQRLEIGEEECDAALSTWTLCTIPDLGAALSELRRVLKPGGQFHFVEHGHSPDPHVSAWQDRLDTAHQRLFGGCHLTRRIPQEIEAAGFVVEELHEYYSPGLKFSGYTFEGSARRP